MNITNNSFSFTDYIGYLFPGILLIISLHLKYPTMFDTLLSDKVLAFMFLLIVGYYLGYISLILAGLSISLLERIFGDLYTSTYNDKLCKEFKKKLILKLEEKFGKDLINEGSRSNLIYLCWIDIQKEPTHGALSYLSRLVSLRTICTASFIPLITLTFILFDIWGYYSIILFFIIFIGLIFTWRDLKISFTKHIFRIWYVLN